MKRVILVLLAAAACSDDEPTFHSVMETDADSYVASDDPTPRYDYAVTVVVKIRNTSDQIIRVSNCTTSATHPPFAVETSSGGDAAWNPVLTCELSGVPVSFLTQGQERTDTITLRSPWQRLFNGQPLGATEGRFYIAYETHICASITASGNCVPINQVEYVRSNTFTVTTR